ncbi:Crp/Fnr family transcriptional regulator [Microlunatus ginsengisoli]|uniref:Crp/Fnr family transcriptional regulator n=1 Tax=Microlunatus ginsengisoli TaxID=363863 RepID=A0ABP6ZLT5_9ACTN
MAAADPLLPAATTARQPNRLLAAIPPAEQNRLALDLTLVELAAKASLYDIDEPISHVYFPLDCVISVVADLDDETVVEVATVGAEGFAGLPAFLGATSSPHRAFCQVPGQALRLDVDVMHRFFAGDGVLHQLMLRYTQAVTVFLAQNVACNQLHTSEQRCARWLAQTHDRVGRDTFPLTQEFLGQMLGVRRATVSLSAQVLQQAGLIRYRRGLITVVDESGLHAAACSCYDVIRREFEKLP